MRYREYYRDYIGTTSRLLGWLFGLYRTRGGLTFEGTAMNATGCPESPLLNPPHVLQRLSGVVQYGTVISKKNRGGL